MAPFTSEADLLAQIQLAYSNGETRLFRVNAGISWAGKIAERTARKLVLIDYHPVKLGPAGFSDLAGWSRQGGRAIFTAIETKFGRHQPTPEQLAFLRLVLAAGGRAGVARNLEDAAAILNASPGMP